MNNSERYLDLEKRARILSASFLPSVLLRRTPTPLEEDFTIAFMLMFHAEVENFIEDLASSIFDDLKKRQNTFENLSRLARPNCQRIVKEFEHILGKNNGVKEDNIVKLYEWFGFGVSDFNSVDPLFLDRMTELGTNRGRLAHKSTIGMSKKPNPNGEKKFSEEIMIYLSKFDRLILRYRLKPY